MKKKTSIVHVKPSRLMLVCFFFLFVALIGRLFYLCMIDFKVKDTTIKSFIAGRNIQEDVIEPKRGTIYDIAGNILANDVSSYTLIAYLSPTRSEGSNELRHVADKQATAASLATVLDMDINDILAILYKENLYQVEFGSKGKGLSQIEMEEIQALNLPGIDFIKSTKRYYPSGDFASYTLGYTAMKTDENGETSQEGEMGIEAYYNDDLTGEKGYSRYEKDKNGYRIANGVSETKEAVDGNDIYLTLDSNIQLFVETAIDKLQEASEAEWTLMMVVDAKTGAILANASTPSFNPNERNMTSYLNPFISNVYEPGSTMKIFSYMCAIESGKYDGNATFTSGSKDYYDKNDDTKIATIKDWNKTGWGVINYDLGFALSSNVGVANMLETMITKEELKECYSKYGFGKTTNFTLWGESAGTVNFNYPIDAAAAGYGQGITTTPMQHIQALTAIANDGEMLKPYIVDKIVSTDDNILYQGKREVIDTIATKSTIDKVKSLMESVVQPDSSVATGYAYYIDGYDIIGKTGTAQIYDYQNGKYLEGSRGVTYSFSGIFPKDEPEIIIYAASSKQKDTTNYLASSVKDVIINVSKYLNISMTDNQTSVGYEVNSYLNKNIKDISEYLIDRGIDLKVIGTGEKIIKQYPSNGSTIYSGDKLFLLTEGYQERMIDIIGYSKKEAVVILDLMNIDYEMEGNGYVTSQSILSGEVINDKVLIKLNPKY
ncbi:MAG: penicillin-binding protein [bacterium]|nr:penicillin-binding protein [bacterium]